jgi:uncharacterized protein (UPF0179 family)
MDNKEEIITVVGLKQSKIGFLFLHEKPLAECEECRLYKVCMTNLEANRVYEVIEVRDKHFPCNIHEEGVQVVKVVEADREVAINPKFVFPQAIITYQTQECHNMGCPHYITCVPQGLKNGDKVKILKVKDAITCPEGNSLIEVILRRRPPQLQHP